MDHAIDFRRIAFAAASGALRTRLVDDDLDPLAYLALEPPIRDRALPLHEESPTLLLDIFGNGFGEVVRGRSIDCLVAEAADAIEFGFLQPIEEQGEIVISLAGEPDDEGRPDGEVRADLAPAGYTLQCLLLHGRPPHALEHGGACVLKRDVEIRQDLAVSHERNDRINVRIGVDVVQTDPNAE